eukprot:CAMPEP_0171328872 /NCGR_PEP_ID=MMETSP0878-20121228/898_1 /TAXON_ID=67004 /ORGANISM="Thalassiosira weissflogii, Strain CCMP1336" /LENGTH=215 /DNA_ID=CAMNT_0011828757 /DNA_START=33 /DNA_END=680 /DNA_ORIENTATION=+
MSSSIKISLLALVAQAEVSQGFLPTRSLSPIASLSVPSKAPTITTPLNMVIEVGPTDDDIEDLNTPPGQMKISEIKSELDLRKVSYSDCFDRESLELRLNSARASGKADPSIIDEFNRRNQEAEGGKSLEVSEDMVESAVGGDGTLPGGMPPEMLMEMMQDEELVTMLRSPKMQEVMKLVMSGGQEALEETLKNDREAYECVQKLNQIMGKMNKK